MFSGFEKNHVIDRATRLGLLTLQIIDIRDYAPGCFRKVDDSPYGGGAGMILRVQPVLDAVEDAVVKNADAACINANHKGVETLLSGAGAAAETLLPAAGAAVESAQTVCRIALTPGGETYTQKTAVELAGMDQIILVCGHYEGMDARIYNHMDRLVSVGDYVLSGGEIAAMAVADSVARLLPGVLKAGSLAEESFTDGMLEYPQYTRPAVYKGEAVPDVLLSGNHEAIRAWRKEQAQKLTQARQLKQS